MVTDLSKERETAVNVEPGLPDLSPVYQLFWLFTLSDIRSASEQTLETDLQPPKSGVKRPRLIGLGRPSICLPKKK